MSLEPVAWRGLGRRGGGEGRGEDDSSSGSLAAQLWDKAAFSCPHV